MITKEDIIHWFEVLKNKDYIAEGLVLKAPCGLLNRRGKRIITKIKYCDYKDL